MNWAATTSTNPELLPIPSPSPQSRSKEMSSLSLLHVVSRSSVRPQTFRAVPTISQTRPLSHTAFRSYPKDDQDRNSINTESSEHTKSSTDSDAAAQDEAAYSPNKTSPESELESAGDGKKVGPPISGPYFLRDETSSEDGSANNKNREAEIH